MSFQKRCRTDRGSRKPFGRPLEGSRESPTVREHSVWTRPLRTFMPMPRCQGPTSASQAAHSRSGCVTPGLVEMQGDGACVQQRMLALRAVRSRRLVEACGAERGRVGAALPWTASAGAVAMLETVRSHIEIPWNWAGDSVGRWRCRSWGSPQTGDAAGLRADQRSGFAWSSRG